MVADGRVNASFFLNKIRSKPWIMEKVAIGADVADGLLGWPKKGWKVQKSVKLLLQMVWNVSER